MRRKLAAYLAKPNGGPPDAGKKGFGGPPRVIASTIVIFILSQFIAALIVEAGLSIFKPSGAPGLDNSVAGQFVYILIAEGLAAYLAIKLVRRHGLGLSAIGLGRRLKLDDLLKTALGFAIFYGLLIITGLLVNTFSPQLTNEKQNLGFSNLSNGLQHAIAFVSLVIIPPLGEETLIRGYLYSGLRKAWRYWPAVLGTSVLFGAAHLEFGSGGPLVWAAALDTFILSIVLCFLRERTGAIYAGILVHMLNNLVAFSVAFK